MRNQSPRLSHFLAICYTKCYENNFHSPESTKLIDALATVERNEIVSSTSKDSGQSRSYGFLRLRLPQVQPILPGQFAMLKKHGVVEPLLRRAMAYYRTENISESTSVEFIYQILGRGTQAIATLQKGEKVECLGALGNTYDVQAAQGKSALLVVGGVGSAAVFMLAQELVSAKIPTRLFIGGASRGDLLGLNDFENLLGKENIFCATVDGSEGEKGFVTAPLEKYLLTNHSNVMYSCGPDAMLHAVARVAEKYEVPTQVSLEAPMACGFGICVGCAVAVKHECDEGFVYKKVCTDGPIFWSSELKW
jgi:dihydroorotate dehydrogenase electron transfer subunit